MAEQNTSYGSFLSVRALLVCSVVLITALAGVAAGMLLHQDALLGKAYDAAAHAGVDAQTLDNLASARTDVITALGLIAILYAAKLGLSGLVVRQWRAEHRANDLRRQQTAEAVAAKERLRHAYAELEALNEQIRQSGQAQLRAIVDHAIDGLITINDKGVVESFNPACERIFGYHAEEVLGRNVAMLMPEPDHSQHDGYLKRYNETGKAAIIGTAGREVRARRKNGSIFPMDLSISGFFLDGRQHFSGILRDITARKQAEADLMRYMKELEQSNQDLDDFAYIASHDLKEPLRGLFNHASFLLEDYRDVLDEEGVRRLNRLLYLAQRMEQLVNDLLYFSRLGRGQQAVQITNPNEIVCDIGRMMESMLRERGARIVILSMMPSVMCDKPRITEVFRNLITNAVKYNDKPRKTVEIGFLSEVDAPQGTEKNVFYVRDNGVGIAPEFHSEIFRLFKRLGNDNENDGGTGVGLTFVKKIIERHKGRIWLESRAGEGTTFYFNLGQEAEYYGGIEQNQPAAHLAG
ncbi:MAG: PAS domain S-box protein [Alphaproteobacteria bacterium]|nr:PAS domain S-box protein [Alphaproteobacteria bacterium]